MKCFVFEFLTAKHVKLNGMLLCTINPSCWITWHVCVCVCSEKRRSCCIFLTCSALVGAWMIKSCGRRLLSMVLSWKACFYLVSIFIWIKRCYPVLGDNNSVSLFSKDNYGPWNWKVKGLWFRNLQFGRGGLICHYWNGSEGVSLFILYTICTWHVRCYLMRRVFVCYTGMC
jgi:hypothetical protein